MILSLVFFVRRRNKAERQSKFQHTPTDCSRLTDFTPTSRKGCAENQYVQNDGNPLCETLNISSANSWRQDPVA